jgi:hypothetical protein
MPESTSGRSTARGRERRDSNPRFPTVEVRATGAAELTGVVVDNVGSSVYSRDLGRSAARAREQGNLGECPPTNSASPRTTRPSIRARARGKARPASDDVDLAVRLVDHQGSCRPRPGLRAAILSGVTLVKCSFVPCLSDRIHPNGAVFSPKGGKAAEISISILREAHRLPATQIRPRSEIAAVKLALPARDVRCGAGDAPQRDQVALSHL